MSLENISKVAKKIGINQDELELYGNYKAKIYPNVYERSKNNPDFAKLVEQENINLEVAVKVRDLRENMGMSQRAFASLIGKPQSTIARIENGSMNASAQKFTSANQNHHIKKER